METHNLEIVSEIENALRDDDSARKNAAEAGIAKAEEQNTRVSRISSFLRYIGVGVLLAGIGCFMFQHWGLMGHVQRYLSFVGFTGAVCGAGLLCGLRIKENKGARTLLGAVVLLVPVHCAQLGAILYSQFESTTHYPAFFHWDAGSMAGALLALSVGLLTLIPMAFMSYSVLARKHAAILCTLGFGVSGLLIIPTRDPLLMSALLAVGATSIFVVERMLMQVTELRTREALLARSVPLVALCLLVGRQYELYYMPSTMFSVVLAVAAAGLFEYVPRMTQSRAMIAASEYLALMFTVAAGLVGADGVISGLRLYSSTVAPLLNGVPIAIALGLMSTRARETTQSYRNVAALAIFLTGAYELMGPYNTGCLVALVFGIVSITWACVAEQRPLLFAGGSLTLVALIDAVYQAYTTIWFSPWITLGAIGISTIVGASYLERNFAQIKESLGLLRQRVGAWK